MSHKTFARSVIALPVTLVLLEQDAGAVTICREETVCPLCGNKFVTENFASYGSYVFQWESKYDLIYFPASEQFWFWLCAKCGYAQTGGDFSRITREDAQRLRSIFEKEWQPRNEDNIPFAVKLERTVRTNELLGRDEEFWCRFNRVLIYHYRSISRGKASVYAEKEIGLLEKNRASDSESRKRTLYLLGEYNLMLGRSHTAERNLTQSLSLRLHTELTRDRTLATVAILPVGLVMWLGVRRKLWIKVPVTLLLITLGVWTWRSYGQIHAELESRNSYYDAIIQDRLALLRQGKPTSGQRQPVAPFGESTPVR